MAGVKPLHFGWCSSALLLSLVLLSREPVRAQPSPKSLQPETEPVSFNCIVSLRALAEARVKLESIIFKDRSIQDLTALARDIETVEAAALKHCPERSLNSSQLDPLLDDPLP